MCGLRPSPRARVSSASNAMPRGGAKSSPTTLASGRLVSSAGRTPAKACSTTSTLIEASDRMNNCSATASRQFSGTSIAPSRAQA